MSSFLYTTGAVLARWLSPGVAIAMTEIIARSQYYARAASRQIVLHNLRIISSDEKNEKVLRAAARNVFSNFGKSIYWFLRLPDMDTAELESRCDYGGLDKIVAELAAKGGFIIAGPHVGPWEVAGALLSALGVRVHTVALDHPSRGVTDFFQERRKGTGIVSYPLGGSFSHLCDALRQGGCVALLIDRTYGRVRGSYPLFGLDSPLPMGHAALAVRCRVPIVTAACVFAPDGRFRFVFKGPYYADTGVGEEAAVENLHRRCREDMEEFIRSYPDQWFHFTKLEGESTCPKLSNR